MKKHLFITALMVLAAILALPTDATAQKRKKKKEAETEQTPPPAPEKKEEKKDKNAIKAFEEVIESDSLSDDGLFGVHIAEDKYYFEIKDDVLGREILIVSRIASTVDNLNFGGAGMKSRPQQVVRWQKHNKQILLRSVSFNNVASMDDPIYESVKNNNFEPIIESFKIEAYNRDTTGYLIDVTKLFTTDVEMIGALRQSQRKNFQISGLDRDRSLISWMKSFPENVEVRHVLTYNGKNLPDNRLTNTLSVEMNQSFIVLPEEPMQPRLHDARVGYFSIRQTNYSLDEQKAAQRRYITRWRLEPSDVEAYQRGELVEPVKPIVYYIDPATPVKWREYIKQGVNDWQVAFEAAGFKNAIYAKDPPSKEEDPDWSPEDVRYSVIRYITTDIQNAQGPHVHDPRSGEILESDILWYHNVMNLLRNWYFIQTAPNNPAAQAVKFEDEVMGQLIRFVSAHEVGHTLGLPHNMGSSVAYPVDSLRSPTFTATHGTAPSIMDYARFNYVAQPEDGVTNFYPKIGEYDVWSIQYGYTYFPEADSPEDEHEILHEWILEKADNPVYRYGRQGNSADPSSQTEDLGDDAVYASDLGIENLKRIIPKLITWTRQDGKPFDELDELYGQVFSQFRRYVGHVSTNIGGVYEYYKTFDQDEPVYTPVDADKQRAAVEFMSRQVFDTPKWLVSDAILGRIEASGHMDRMRNFQEGALRRMFSAERLYRLCEGEALRGADAYPLSEMFTTVTDAIWSELNSNAEIDIYRRNLQRAFVVAMKELLELDEEKYDQTDIKAYARHTLREIQRRISSRRHTSEAKRVHLADISHRIQEILDVSNVKKS